MGLSSKKQMTDIRIELNFIQSAPIAMNRELWAQLQCVYRTRPWSSWAAHCCSTHWTWTRTHRLWPAPTAPSAAPRRQPRWCHCPSVALRPRDCFIEAGVDNPGCRWTCLRGREGHGGRARVPAHIEIEHSIENWKVKQLLFKYIPVETEKVKT
jgi:hypothetical protein